MRNITFALYDQMTPLDFVGPFQVLFGIPGIKLTLAAVEAGPVRTDSGMSIVADTALRDVARSDIIVVPGTSRPDVPMSNRALVNWLAAEGPRAEWLCSVCTGSLVLGEAGLLKGRRATTHWSAVPMLATFGATAEDARVVFDGQLVTAAGVSAGIDMALSLVTRLWGAELAQAIQLIIEYDPAPPHDAGSPRTAPKAIVDRAMALMAEFSAPA